MGLRRKVITGSGMLMGGQVLSQACGFLRNVIVARMLTPEDFGVAATLSIAMSMLDMISNLAVDRLLVQAEDGNEPKFQATAQLFQVVRGVGLALALFVLAWPFSVLFDLPGALWAFQCVALIPLIRGFVHLDSKRFQRQLGFSADIATDLLPQIILVLAAWPITWWLKDYSAMVWLLVLQVVFSAGMSHAVAKRRYEWAWNRQFLERIYVFGWPLLLNGLLMFFILQGDRLIIGSAYDMATLGVYSVAFSITFVPSTMIAKVASSVLLPLLSNQQGDLQKFSEYYACSVYALCLVGVSVSAAFILLGERIILFTYGAKYANVEPYIGWMAIMQMVRVLRVGPTIASMARGDTRTPLLSNFGRVSVIPVAIWIGLSGGSLMWIVVTGCVGELVALLMMVFRLDRSSGLTSSFTLMPTLICACAVFVAFLVRLSGEPNCWWISYPVSLILVIGGASCGILYSLPSVRPQLSSLLRFRLRMANEE